jgi:hypothetical protein
VTRSDKANWQGKKTGHFSNLQIVRTVSELQIRNGPGPLPAGLSSQFRHSRPILLDQQCLNRWYFDCLAGSGLETTQRAVPKS